MEPALKQRLLGAAVLVALAVTFLPMLVMDPAPESGASDVPLRVPKAPEGGIETRELPLFEPVASGPVLPATAAPAVPAQGAIEVGPAEPAPAESPMLPAATAGGDYAVSFGSYATAADAARVVGSLRASQLPGYAEAVTSGGRSLHRVRIGPYATRADAEAARLRAAHVRDDVGAKVVALDVGAGQPTAPKATPKPPAVATATRTPVTPAPPPPPAAVAAAPAASVPKPAPATAPAAASVGFAVQLAAFANAAEAQRLQDRARAAGFSAFVQPVPTENGTMHRVRIGPVADRPAAERLRGDAAAKLGVSGLVRPHP